MRKLRGKNTGDWYNPLTVKYLNQPADNYTSKGYMNFAATLIQKNYRGHDHRFYHPRSLHRGYDRKKHGLTYNPYTKYYVKYLKPTHRFVYNPYSKKHTKIKLGKPTSRLIYNPYSKTFSKHECRGPLCGCS